MRIIQRLEVHFIEPDSEYPAGSWHAQVDCDCGSTLTSGITWPTPTGAVRAAQRNLVAHLDARYVPRDGERKCGTSCQRAVQCRCAECKAHDVQLAKLIG